MCILEDCYLPINDPFRFQGPTEACYPWRLARQLQLPKTKRFIAGSSRINPWVAGVVTREGFTLGVVWNTFLTVIAIDVNFRKMQEKWLVAMVVFRSCNAVDCPSLSQSQQYLSIITCLSRICRILWWTDTLQVTVMFERKTFLVWSCGLD